MEELKENNPLLGKTLIGLKVAADRQALLFVTEETTPIRVRVDGDCCSHSWVENLEMPALGLPAKVLDIVDQGEINNEWDEGGGELTRFYITKIVTDRGELVIDYRNSSNGYYGGNLVWPHEEYHYGGVRGQNISKEEWEEWDKMDWAKN